MMSCRIPYSSDRTHFVAALFFSRRRRRNFLSTSNPEDAEGVRICIPLDAITSHTRQIHASTLPILELTVIMSTAPKLEASNSELPAPDTATRTIQFALHKLDEHWEKLQELVQASKRNRRSDSSDAYARSVVVDFGLGDTESAPNDVRDDSQDTRSKEQIVCEILAIDYTPHVWSMFTFLLSIMQADAPHSYYASYPSFLEFGPRMHGLSCSVSLLDRILEQILHYAGCQISLPISEHPQSDCIRLLHPQPTKAWPHHRACGSL